MAPPWVHDSHVFWSSRYIAGFGIPPVRSGPVVTILLPLAASPNYAILQPWITFRSADVGTCWMCPSFRAWHSFLHGAPRKVRRVLVGQSGKKAILMASERRIAPYTKEFVRLYSVGDEVAAIGTAVEALASGASFAPPFESVSWLADELRRKKSYRLGLQLVEDAFARGYRGWRIDFLRGQFQALNRDLEQAVHHLDRSIASAPDEEARRIRLLKARLLAILGKRADALACFRSGLRFGKDPARLVNTAIRLALSTRKDDLAARWTKRANAAYGISADRMRLLADSRFARREWAEARQAAVKGLEADPDNIALRRLRSMCLYHERKFGRAIGFLEDLLQVDSSWDEGKILLCRSLVAGGRRREALQILRSVQEQARNSPEVSELFAALTKDENTRLSEEPTTARKRRNGEALPVDPEVRHLLNNTSSEFKPSWTPADIAASGNMVRALGTFVHSVRTIMLREIMARFGRHEIGYLWAILEPLIHVIALSFIFYFIRMRDSLGMNVVLFVATGVIPLFFYLKTFNSLTNALRQNRPLLNHAGIQPMDIFFARSTLEFFTQLFVFILFAVTIYLYVDKYSFGSPLSVLANMFGLWIMGIGAGLLVGSLVVYFESLPNVMNGFNRIIYVTSGVFFTLDRLPPSVAEYASYNPLLHFVDGVRGNFNPLMGGGRVDIVYGFSWAFAILMLGLIADRALRHRVLDR